jgi:isoleucyl-tRNA synthetase
MPHHNNIEPDSILYNPMPKPKEEFVLSPSDESMWETLLRLRSDVNKALELSRADKIIGKPLEAEVTIYLDDSATDAFSKIDNLDLKSLFIVSSVIIRREPGSIDVDSPGIEGVDFPGIIVSVKPCLYNKCARCWIHYEDVGSNSQFPELCQRCIDVVSSLEELIC